MASTFEVASLARSLMNEHGLHQWRFQFDKATKRFGVCKYASRTIGLSEKMVRANDIERVRETILHEIAHALAGPNAGHGPAWVRQARALGIKGDRCYSAETTTLVGNYFAFCPACGVKPISSRVQAPTGTNVCNKHRLRVVWKDARGNEVAPKAKVSKTYEVVCDHCGVIGTTHKRSTKPLVHRNCGFSVRYRLARSAVVR